MVSEDTPMPVTIWSHFDGKVIVPEEPIDLPVKQRLQVVLTPVAAESPTVTEHERKAALDRVLARAWHSLRIPEEALRCEDLSAATPPDG